MAERGGFEPPVREARTTAFEAAAFNRSAISPWKVGLYPKFAYEKGCSQRRMATVSGKNHGEITPRMKDAQ